VCRSCPRAGSERARHRPSNALAQSTKNTLRGPQAWAITAASGSASIGPMEMVARERPARRAAPWASAVARVWVLRLKLA